MVSQVGCLGHVAPGPLAESINWTLTSVVCDAAQLESDVGSQGCSMDQPSEVESKGYECAKEGLGFDLPERYTE